MMPSAIRPITNPAIPPGFTPEKQANERPVAARVQNPDDKRSRLVQLTASGDRKAKTISKELMARNQEIIHGILSEGEAGQLADLLVKLKRRPSENEALTWNRQTCRLLGKRCKESNIVCQQAILRWLPDIAMYREMT